MPDGTMRAVMKMKAGVGAEMSRAPIPKPGFGEILVKVKTASICGSDVHIYKWNSWAQQHVKPPQIMGHELAGEVVELGEGVNAVKEGDFISAETHISCGYCKPCRTGNPHICSNLKILGVDTNGVFADYVVIPEKVAWKNDPSIPPVFASVQEPLGNAIDTVLSEDVAGKKVIITGAGPIGIIAAGVAKISGACEVYITDINEYRLGLAKKMGADVVLNPRKQDVVRFIMDATNGEGVDVALEMSGNENALIQACECLSPGGRLSILGVFNRDVTLDLNNLIIFKGIRVYGVTGRRIFSTWYKAGNFLKSGLLDLSPVITHEFKLEEFDKAFELMMSGNSGKIVLHVE